MQLQGRRLPGARGAALGEAPGRLAGGVAVGLAAEEHREYDGDEDDGRQEEGRDHAEGLPGGALGVLDLACGSMRIHDTGAGVVGLDCAVRPGGSFGALAIIIEWEGEGWDAGSEIHAWCCCFLGCTFLSVVKISL